MPTLRTLSTLAALACVLVLLSACGLTSVRRSQDWSGVDDPRLALACHVGNYGSGVLLSCDDAGADVLTCAHLVDAGESVTVRFHDAATGEWVAYAGTVVRRTHPHREDLAVVEIRDGAFHLPPQRTPLADPVDDGTELTVALVNIAFGAEERPFVLELPALAHVASVSTFEPDVDGQTSWRVPKVLVHGGVTQANSGSPVFLGDRLAGLAESAPAFAPSPAGPLLIGIEVSSPVSVRAAAGR